MQQYNKIKELNDAGYRRLWYVQNKQSGEKFAMRLISITEFDEDDIKKIMLESSIAQQLNHINITKIKEAFTDKDSQQIVIIMEFADRGLDKEIELWKNDKSLVSIPKIVKYFKQVLDALSYCHNQKVIHRNIKPQNILMFSSQQANEFIPKLTDFGCATLLTTKNKTVSKVGTINYMAPEIFDGKGYAFPVDIWAMGCVLYEMVTTEQAFPGSNMSKVTDKIMKCKIDMSKIPQELQAIITKLLCKDEGLRITVDSLMKDEIFNLKQEQKAQQAKQENAHSISIIELKHIDNIQLKDGVYLESVVKPKQYLSIKDRNAPECACWSLQNIKDQDYNIFNTSTNTYMSCSEQPHEDSQITSASSKQNATWQIIKEADYCFLTINEQYAVEVSGSVKLSLIDKDVLVQQFKIHVILNGVEQQNTVQGAVQQDNEKPVSEPIELRKIEKLEKDGIYIESMGKKNHYICVKQQDLNNLEAASWIIKRFGEQGVTIENTKTKLKLMSPDCPANKGSALLASNEMKNNVWLVVKSNEPNSLILKLDEDLALEVQGKELKIEQYDKESFVQMFRIHVIENGKECNFAVKKREENNNEQPVNNKFSQQQLENISHNVFKNINMNEVEKLNQQANQAKQNLAQDNKQATQYKVGFTQIAPRNTQALYILEFSDTQWAMSPDHAHGSQSQQWVLQKAEGELYMIQNVGTGFHLACVDQKCKKGSQIIATNQVQSFNKFSIKYRQQAVQILLNNLAVSLFTDKNNAYRPGLAVPDEQDKRQLFLLISGTDLMQHMQPRKHDKGK